MLFMRVMKGIFPSNQQPTTNQQDVRRSVQLNREGASAASGAGAGGVGGGVGGGGNSVAVGRPAAVGGRARCRDGRRSAGGPPGPGGSRRPRSGAGPGRRVCRGIHKNWLICPRMRELLWRDGRLTKDDALAGPAFSAAGEWDMAETASVE